jgi:hypothetical protein
VAKLINGVTASNNNTTCFLTRYMQDAFEFIFTQEVSLN